MSETQQQRLSRAEAYAEAAHGEQKYGVWPYRYHLQRVADIAREFSVEDADVHVAAWLHDCVEDTGETRESIAAAFGERVAELVWAVTDAPGDSRAERHRATHPKINQTPGAVTLKLCDRLANTRQCLTVETERNTRKLAMYRAEYPGFRAALHHSPTGATARLWDALDALCAAP